MRIPTIILALLAGPAAADGYGFMTPSGNIYCNGSVEASEMSCVIINRVGPSPQPRPAGCGQAWGHHFAIGPTGPGSMQCGPYPGPVNYSDIAPYGVSGQFGAITCWSEKTGLTCRNPQGHGFFLSRRSQQVF